MFAASGASSVPGALYRLAGEILGAQVLGRERTHISSQHPDLIVGDPPAPRRHSIRPSLIDRLEHLARRPAKMPATVLKARTHRARSLRPVTVEAVVTHEQLAADS